MTIKKMLFILSMAMVAATGFAENLVLDNQTSYPSDNPRTKMAIEWASSGKEVEEENHALMSRKKLNTNRMQMIRQSGTVNLNLPQNAEYFRVLVWSNGEGEPDLHTNWVDVVPNKTYTLKPDLLVPTVLMSGSGC